MVAILGARQCGKTTLAKQFAFSHYFDLENRRDMARLEDPQLALEDLEGLIVIDEIQCLPDLFPLNTSIFSKDRYRLAEDITVLPLHAISTELVAV